MAIIEFTDYIRIVGVDSMEWAKRHGYNTRWVNVYVVETLGM